MDLITNKFRIPYRDPPVKLGMTWNLEFLRINLEFLEIAPSALLPRNDGIFDGILNEIAPSALLPLNDAGNSRFSTGNSRIPKKLSSALA